MVPVSTGFHSPGATRNWLVFWRVACLAMRPPGKLANIPLSSSSRQIAEKVSKPDGIEAKSRREEVVDEVLLRHAEIVALFPVAAYFEDLAAFLVDRHLVRAVEAGDLSIVALVLVPLDVE